MNFFQRLSLIFYTPSKRSTDRLFEVDGFAFAFLSFPRQVVIFFLAPADSFLFLVCIPDFRRVDFWELAVSNSFKTLTDDIGFLSLDVGFLFSLLFVSSNISFFGLVVSTFFTGAALTV